jgi:hypothetical protein
VFKILIDGFKFAEDDLPCYCDCHDLNFLTCGYCGDKRINLIRGLALRLNKVSIEEVLAR